MNQNEMWGMDDLPTHKHVCYRCNESFDCDLKECENKTSSICGNCDKRFNAENEYLKRFNRRK